jgi:hypothetical protein
MAAVSALLRILADATTTDSVKVAAARTVLSSAPTWNEQATLNARIAALERMMLVAPRLN